MSRKDNIIFQNNQLKVTECGEEVFIEDLEAPELSDSVLIVKSKTFWDMIKTCSSGLYKRED